jgi:hypothetical protein
MAIQLAEPLLKRLKLEQSLRAERDRAQDRLPSRVAEDAVASHGRKYATWLAGACAAGFDPAPQEVMWMPKGPLRYRPLSALPLAERVVFRAFADDLARNVTPLDAYQDSRDTFERSILEADDEFTHFGLADVASFYRYVPHSLLAERIIEATGRGDLANAVREFLRTAMQSDVGLPQNVGPSDQFADLVIGPVERRLIRRGYAVSRYNDDFRIAGRSNRAVRRGLEALQAELHEVGFTLNDSKTRILRRETFEAHVEQVAGADYEDAGDIGDEPATTAILNSTTRMLRASLRQPPTGSRSRLQEATALDRVRRALRRLTRWKDPSALNQGQAIVNRYPSLTQQYAIYCAALAEDGSGAEVGRYLQRVFPRLILTWWQDLWLLQPIIAGAPAGVRLRRWIVSRVEGGDVPPMLRARAALAGASAGLVSSETALRLVEILPEAARPDAIAAYAVANGEASAKKALAGLPDTLLAGWVFDHHS